MFCTNCGNAGLAGATFCAQCGTSLGQSAFPAEQIRIHPAQTQQWPSTVGNAPTYTPAPTSSGVAIAALIVVFFFPLLGLILGYVAQSDIRSSRGMKSGQGIATSAIILGWIFTIIGVLWFFSIMS